MFGQRQDPGSPYSAVIPLFITALLEGRRPVIYGDGEQTRDFTFIENVVHGNMLAAKAPAEKVAGKVFNVANGRSISLNQMLAKLNQLLGTDVQATFEDARVGDDRDSLAVISEARACLGYDPIVDFDTGLEKSIEFYKSLLVS